MVRKNVEKLFKKFASPTTIYVPGYEPKLSHGFIQPLRYKNKMYVDTHMEKLGLHDDGRCVYIGLPEVCLTDGNLNGRKIVINDLTYAVIRAEDVYYKGEAIYVWAIVKRDRGGVQIG